MESGIHIILKGEELVTVFGLPITNGLLMAWVVVAVIVAFAFFAGRSLRLVPGKLQAGIEFVYESAHDYIAEVLESKKLATVFFPLLSTIFLFIFVSNELAFLPGVGSMGLFHHDHFTPLLRAPAADLNFTLALAAIAFLIIEIAGLVVLGTAKYGKKYLNFSSPVHFITGIIEIASNLGRLISFSFRLFGNVFAGEVMIVVVGFFLSYLLPAPVIAFEMFVGLVQAVVFAMLTLFFIKLSIIDPHEQH